MATRFWKYHGLGNDFVLVDRRGLGDINPALTRQICARRTGVGADGILGLYDDGGPKMRVFNSDGSIADMCGNGLRCFVAWLIDEFGATTEPFTVQTDAGPQPCTPRTDSDGHVTGITVNLGAAVFDGDIDVQVGDRSYRGTRMTLGNPHFVITRRADAEEASTYGPALSTHDAFPAGANIEWLDVQSPQSANLVVYERGAGLTLACGTGGGGAAASAVRQGLLDADTDLALDLPGGRLTYRVAADFGAVHMTGPAERVFSAEFPFDL